MTSSDQKPSWLRAIKEAANQQRISLPPFVEAGMGSAFCRTANRNRFVSFKRRLVSAKDAANHGTEWTLWQDEDDQPSTVAVFREPLIPNEDRVAAVLSVLRGWLLDQWTVEAVQQLAATSANASFERIIPSKAGRQEYWLSIDRGFGFIVENDSWAVYSRDKSLSAWRTRKNDRLGDRLPLSSLDHFCAWIAHHWYPILYGNDVRPALLRDLGVAASWAYDDVQLLRPTGPEIRSWWSRHAMRVADEELPNVFFERQADDLVVSWNAMPTPTRFYSIPFGEQVLPISFAMPVLRQLVHSRLKQMQLGDAERSRLLEQTSDGVVGAYKTLSQYRPSMRINQEWLARYGFSDEDARKFAIAGTSRNPIVGLLRTSQGSSILREDFENILRLLRPSDAQSYLGLQEIAKGISTAVDVRTPWESGYRLAALVRDKLEIPAPEQFDVESEARALGIEVSDVGLADTTILGACVGASMYAPLIVINPSCEDARGISGRRITLAHELCHLLFDRSRMLSLARFEGETAASDRMIEMRANAFAVELLVPMSTLIGEDGAVLDDDALKQVSIDRQVSLAALSRHAANLRSRLTKH